MATTAELLALYDSQLRLVVPPHPPEGHIYELDGQLLRVSRDHRGFVETAQRLDVDGEALDALIAFHRDYFARRGDAVEWKTRAHDLPADLPERLLAAGFVPEESETVMVAETARMVTSLSTPPKVTITAVHDKNDFDRISELQAEVWGGDFAWLAADLHDRQTAAPDDLVVFVAEAGGRFVSAAWLVLADHGDFAGLWGGSTLADWRGQGIYKALVARRAEIALQRGVQYLQVDASDDSKPILQRLGFLPLTTTTPYVWSPARPTPIA